MLQPPHLWGGILRIIYGSTAAVILMASLAVAAELPALEFVEHMKGGYSGLRNSGTQPIVVSGAFVKERPECNFELVIGQDTRRTLALMDRSMVELLEKVREHAATDISQESKLILMSVAVSFRRAQQGEEPALLPGQQMAVLSTNSPCHGTEISTLTVSTLDGAADLDATGWH
jgi:hypothetical protein